MRDISKYIAEPKGFECVARAKNSHAMARVSRLADFSLFNRLAAGYIIHGQGGGRRSAPLETCVCLTGSFLHVPHNLPASIVFAISFIRPGKNPATWAHGFAHFKEIKWVTSCMSAT